MAITINGTTGISGVDGSAATPALQGTDTNTGISFGTDTVTINTGGVARVTTDASGNVGIGTSSPSTTLHARKDSAGGTTYAIYADNGSAGAGTNVAGIGFTNAGAMKSSITAAVYGNDFMTFNVGGSGTTERMRIDSSGNLLVGMTTAPSASVKGMGYGNFSIMGSDTALVLSGGSNTGNDYQIGFVNGNGLVGVISTSGSTTTYATSSDYRLKENIQPMQNALATVAQLNPVTYKWKSDGSDGQGFIAHELQAVVPDAVTGEKDAVDDEGKPVYQGVDTSFLVGHLVACVKELKAELDSVKAELTTLKGAA